jgi:hypothetical protein
MAQGQGYTVNSIEPIAVGSDVQARLGTRRRFGGGAPAADGDVLRPGRLAVNRALAVFLGLV